MFRVIERSATPDLFEGIMSGGSRVNQRGGEIPTTQVPPPTTPGNPIRVITPTPTAPPLEGGPTPSAPPLESGLTTPTPSAPPLEGGQTSSRGLRRIFDKPLSRAKEFFSPPNKTSLEEVKDKFGTFFKLDWDGFSGLLQWFTKYPIPIDSSWAFTLNQIVWNVLFFILFYGLIYGAIINSGSEMISVPEEIQKQTPSPWTQGIYFSIVTMTSLGFGDITPATFGGQMLVTSQILLFFIFNFIWTLNFDFMESSN